MHDDENVSGVGLIFIDMAKRFKKEPTKPQ